MGHRYVEIHPLLDVIDLLTPKIMSKEHLSIQLGKPEDMCPN